MRVSPPFRSVGSGPEDRWPRPAALGPIRRVLVSFESSTRGRAALSHALGLARRSGAPLTIVSVATRQPENVGCMACRRNAVFWNREMWSLAQEDVAEAASLVGPSPAVDYAVAVGCPAHALGEAADRSGADVIVLPWEPSGRLRRLFSPAVAGRLRKAGRWEVIVAPAAAPHGGDDPQVGVPAGAAGSDQA